jgi:hypothetical protein
MGYTGNLIEKNGIMQEAPQVINGLTALQKAPL